MKEQAETQYNAGLFALFYFKSLYHILNPDDKAIFHLFMLVSSHPTDVFFGIRQGMIMQTDLFKSSLIQLHIAPQRQTKIYYFPISEIRKLRDREFKPYALREE